MTSLSPRPHQFDLTQLVARIDEQDRRIAEQQATIEELRRATPSTPSDPTDVRNDAMPDGPDEPVDRRGLLRRGALLAGAAAAGAVGGGVLAADPAAAATVSGNGNPGVQGTGVGGDGVVGSTDTAGLSGVYGTTSTNGAVGMTARNFASGAALAAYPTNGTAIIAQGVNGHGILGTATGGVNNAGIRGTSGALGDFGVYASHTGTGTALYADSNGRTASLNSSSDDGPVLEARATAPFGAADVVYAYAYGSGNGVYGISSMGTGVRAWSQQGANLVLRPTDRTVVPDSGTWELGAIVVTTDGTVWLCVVAGTPGTWQQLGGAAVAGAFHAVDPIRIFDSRLPGSGGIFTNETRTIDAEFTSAGAASGLPAATTTLAVNLAVTATNSGGFGALFTNGISWPGNASINWAQANTSISNGTNTRVTDRVFQCKIAGTAHVIVDVLGYYL